MIYESKIRLNSIKQLRWIGYAEGISFLALLIIAMPLKYYFSFPLAVKITGWIHGLLFMAYIWAAFRAACLNRWNYLQIAVALIASVIPFGTFVLDKRLKEEAYRLRS